MHLYQRLKNLREKQLNDNAISKTHGSSSKSIEKVDGDLLFPPTKSQSNVNCVGSSMDNITFLKNKAKNQITKKRTSSCFTFENLNILNKEENKGQKFLNKESIFNRPEKFFLENQDKIKKELQNFDQNTYINFTVMYFHKI